MWSVVSFQSEERAKLGADFSMVPSDHRRLTSIYRNASAASIDTRLTSINSSNGIGAAPPCSTACTKAAAHAFCPLFCRHRFILLNPDQTHFTPLLNFLEKILADC